VNSELGSETTQGHRNISVMKAAAKIQGGAQVVRLRTSMPATRAALPTLFAGSVYG
jgi:hypothetical protein